MPQPVTASVQSPLPLTPGPLHMVIEFLSFDIPTSEQPAFIAQDAAIWTATQSRQAGFLGKEIWRNAPNPTNLCLVIRWESRAHWHAVPTDVLNATQIAFVAALGKDHPVLTCTDFDVA